MPKTEENYVCDGLAHQLVALMIWQVLSRVGGVRDY
jgi:hypothetical protein